MNTKAHTQQLLKFVGHSIRRARQIKRYTQEELGSQVGLSRASIVNIERGIQQISTCTLYALALFFKCNVSDFFPRTEKELHMFKVPNQVRVLLPSGTSARVSANEPDKLIKALDKMVILALKKHDKNYGK